MFEYEGEYWEKFKNKNEISSKKTSDIYYKKSRSEQEKLNAIEAFNNLRLILRGDKNVRCK